jgi:hypothetical protein
MSQRAHGMSNRLILVPRVLHAPPIPSTFLLLLLLNLPRSQYPGYITSNGRTIDERIAENFKETSSDLMSTGRTAVKQNCPCA